MTPLYLITGFLGSGKTTFLKNLLQQGTEDEKIVVIQNEFAQTSIDGTELKTGSKEVEIVEINNGSVFCSCLMSSFIDTLKKIVNTYNPTKIFLEASGLADPSTLNQIVDEKELHKLIYLEGSICIVDALNYSKALDRMPRVIQQIRIADFILINKTDLIDGDTLNNINEKIKKQNPVAQIQETTFCNIDLKNLETKNQQGFNFFPGLGQGSDRPDLQSTVLKSTKKIKKENLKSFLDEIQSISIRAKGFVVSNTGETTLFQSVYDNFTTSIYPNYPGNTEFIVIGEDVSLPLVNSIFQKYI